MHITLSRKAKLTIIYGVVMLAIIGVTAFIVAIKSPIREQTVMGSAVMMFLLIAGLQKVWSEQ